MQLFSSFVFTMCLPIGEAYNMLIVVPAEGIPPNKMGVFLGITLNGIEVRFQSSRVVTLV